MANINKKVQAKLLIRIRDKEKRRIFGRLYFGETTDFMDAIIEKGLYEYLEAFPLGNENKYGFSVIEAAVLNLEKQRAIGLPPDLLPKYTYWIGLQILDDELWAKFEKSNTHNISIGVIEEMEKQP